MHNFLGIQNKVDNFKKGVFTDPYDEPTYLTFAIDFNFEEFNVPLNEIALWKSPLFNESEEGAINYLINRGHSDKANSMKIFKEILRYLTFDAPWYFQEIGGLNKFWTQATDMKVGQKGKDLALTVKTLEAVDLRMTELASIYRHSIYDKVHMRERVPDNLRWFSMDIYVAEARNLRYRIPGVGQGLATTFGIDTSTIGNILGGGNPVSNVLQQYGYVKFRCRQCEFDFSDSFSTATTLDIATKNSPVMSSFKINVGYFEEESRYADGSELYDDQGKAAIRNPWSLRNTGTSVTNAGSFLSGLPVIGDDIARAGQSLQNSLATIGGLINPALQAASQFIDPPITSLGNIYGNRSSRP